jgi:hypothetical protein
MRAWTWTWERGIIDRNSGHDDDEVFEEFYGLGDCVASYERRPWVREHQRCGAAFVSCFLPFFSSSLYDFSVSDDTRPLKASFPCPR